MQVMWVLQAAISTNVFKKKKSDFIDWQAFWRQAFFGPKGSYKEFSFFREVYEKIGLPALWNVFI